VSTTQETALSVRNLTKRYGGVVALRDVSLDLLRGEVHALCGQNGAGKSTLIKILGGAVRPNSGRVLIKGKEETLQTPAESLSLGINIIYQDFHLVPDLNIAQNIFLRQEITRGGWLLEDKKMYEETRNSLSLVGAEEIDPRTPVRSLRTGEQQMVEIVKALRGEVQVLIMDEPTASLTAPEKAHLFQIIESLKREGIAILFVSHHLDEVFRVADRISTIRDGELVSSVPASTTNIREVTYWMLGETVASELPPQTSEPSTELLRVEGLTRGDAFSDISFSVRAGEIVGLVGLIGAGRTEIVRAIFGLDHLDSGQVYVDGQPVRIDSPRQAVKAGIALVPEDRKTQGLVLGRSILENFSLAALERFQRAGWVKRKMERSEAENARQRLRLKAPDFGNPIESLSGGNQQKVVLSKWLARRARIYLLDEPTHGVDVGAKVEIRRLIREISEQGGAVLLISSDLDEGMQLMDRVIIIRNGRIARRFDRDEINRDSILRYLLTPQDESITS
jgi:ABC-type sugar transport system ATPase subunit